jgi:MscS family membrane protein
VLFNEYVIWNNTLSQYLIFLAFVFLGVGVGKIFFWVSSKIIRLLTAKTKTRLDDILIDLLEKPVIFLIILGGFYLGTLQLTLFGRSESLVRNVTLVLFVLNASWVVINFIDAVIINYVKPFADKTKSNVDEALIPIIRRVVKIVLWVIVLIMLIKNLGFDVSALITGVGIGGLAFALAAQDLLGNLFGGVAILSDKPFKLGDRIKIGANDGWVREIGLRTTRIETIEGTQLIVPNADIAKGVVENISREKARKVSVRLGLDYSTPNKKIVEAERILTDIVKGRKDLEKDFAVGFGDFGDFAIQLQLIYWINASRADDLMKIKNSINLEIKERFEKAGIKMAFPTSTVYLAKDKVGKK